MHQSASGQMSHICDIFHIYVTFDHYAVGNAFLTCRSTPNVCNVCQRYRLKKLFILWSPFALKIDYDRNFKGGAPVQFRDSVTCPWWVDETFLLL